MTKTATAERKAQIAAEQATVTATADVLLTLAYRKARRMPNRTWARYARAIQKLSALTGTPVPELEDAVRLAYNVRHGLPETYGRWTTLNLTPPSRDECRALLSAAGVLAAPVKVGRKPRKPAPAVKPKGKPAAGAVRGTSDVTETFQCRECKKPFSKLRTRGRKPTVCPSCKGA